VAPESAASGVVASVVRGWRGIGWYLRELTGESAYDRYLERHEEDGRGDGDGWPPLTRREFERLRAERSVQPGSRCC